LEVRKKQGARGIIKTKPLWKSGSPANTERSKNKPKNTVLNLTVVRGGGASTNKGPLGTVACGRLTPSDFGWKWIENLEPNADVLGKAKNLCQEPKKKRRSRLKASAHHILVGAGIFKNGRPKKFSGGGKVMGKLKKRCHRIPWGGGEDKTGKRKKLKAGKIHKKGK